MHPNLNQHVQIETPGARPLDDILRDIYARRGLDRPGGRSRRGWSSRATLQKCPYLYQQTYVNGVQGAASAALETGSIFHAYLANHYLNMMSREHRDECYPMTPEILRDELLDGGAHAGPIMDAWQLYEAYAFRYENDYLRPLAVEVAGVVGEHTCRWDLIAAVDDAQDGVQPGTYIVETKTTSRFDSLNTWTNDGEIVGQLWIYEYGGYAEAWGPLRGVIMNICKKKNPDFQRMIIPPQAWQIDGHGRDLQQWDLLEQLYRTTGMWPRSRASCVTKYGPCALFAHCADGTPLDLPPTVDEDVA